MDFFIKQNSTLPLLRYPLTKIIRDKFDISDDMLENVAVTFSMVHKINGVYAIANVSGSLEVIPDEELAYKPWKYNLVYKFKEFQTSVPGMFYGEFKLDFLGNNCGKLTLPNDEKINITIQKSITKTTVI